MEINNSIISANEHAPRYPSRIPLYQKTSPINSIPSKQVRRKDPVVFQIGSSEEIPSPHASIFDAICTSGNGSEDNDHAIEIQSSQDHLPHHPAEWQSNDENIRFPDITGSAYFLYGKGTILDTISEQKSFTTTRSQRTKSVDGIRNFSLLQDRDSVNLNQSPRRQHSFSLDDLALVKTSYHDAVISIERKAHPKVFDYDYTKPMVPLHAPIERPPTPEGMPSWTASQTRLRTRPDQQRNHSRLRRFLNVTSFVPRLHVGSSLTTKPRSVSTPLIASSGVAPRFRPPKSQYGSLRQHPFNFAQVADTSQPPNFSAHVTLAHTSQQPGKLKLSRNRLSLHVRFPPSVTATDSDTGARQALTRQSSHLLTSNPMLTNSVTKGSQYRACCANRRGYDLETAQPLQPLINPTPRSSVPDIQITDCSTSLLTSIGVPAPLIFPTNSPSRMPSTVSTVETFNSDFGIVNAFPSNADSCSSSTRLMSGALHSPSITPNAATRSLSDHRDDPLMPRKSQSHRCWKCKFADARDSVGSWFNESRGKFYWICCGYENRMDERSRGYDGAFDGEECRRHDLFGDVVRSVGSARGQQRSDRGRDGWEELLSPRMVLLG